MNIEKRDLILAIVLSIVTCGIYQIIWFIKLTDEINEVTGKEDSISGALYFVASLFTCGLFLFFWGFKIGEKVEKLNGSSENYSIIYLVLHFFALDIVILALTQDKLNQYLDKSNIAQ